MSSSVRHPLVIEEQGSFAIGGTVVTHAGAFDRLVPARPEGQTLHGDHARVFHQRPPNARRLPIVFLHGNGQSSKTWESTPDGREGFQTLFLRRRYGVYVVNQPRRGSAGRSTLPMEITAAADDRTWFNIFRVGIWPDYFAGVRFPRDAESLNQYFRQMTPNTGPWDPEVVSSAMAALFDRIGPAILVTHSQGGGSGWLTAIKSSNVRGIVAWEPGSFFAFPEGEVPPSMPSSAGALGAIGVPRADFAKLTTIPIVLYYGDYIAEQPVADPGRDGWRVRLAMARLWAAAVNRHGGDAAVVPLPEIGIRGNTHFPFSDLNNVELADLMARFLEDKGLA
jgi:pimeloyl-ACP methyl ester carboxylesterase